MPDELTPERRKELLEVCERHADAKMCTTVQSYDDAVLICRSVPLLLTQLEEAENKIAELKRALKPQFDWIDNLVDQGY